MHKLVLLFVVVSLSCSVEPGPLVGFCWVSGPSSDIASLEEGFFVAHHMGCQIEHRQYNWNEIERVENEYDWSMLNTWYTACTTYDIVPSLAVCPVNSGGVKSFPRDLEGKSFNDPDVMLRFEKFTQKLFEQYPAIQYVSFGNEINYYLRGHWEDVYPYLELCLHMYQVTREHYPHVGVLVIFGFTGMEKREEDLIPLFLPACDMVGISTYHASVGVGSMTPPRLTEEEMREGIEHCIRLCRGNRFAIVETAAFSYPDPEYQATYVHVFFDVIREYSRELEFACWFGTYDWRPGTLTMMDPFLEQFNSTGLLTPDGIPKASYHAWMEEMALYGVGSPPRGLAVFFLVVITLFIVRLKE